MQDHSGRVGGGCRPQGGGGYNDCQYGGGGGNNRRGGGGIEHNMYARGNNFAYADNAEEVLDDDSSLAFNEAFGTNIGPPQFSQNHQNRMQHYNPSAKLVRTNLEGSVNNKNTAENSTEEEIE